MALPRRDRERVADAAKGSTELRNATRTHLALSKDAPQARPI
jgi:hypothetical protein